MHDYLGTVATIGTVISLCFISNCQFGTQKKLSIVSNRKAPSQKYVVISVTTPVVGKEECAKGDTDCSYAFYLPLTALAWQRLNYSTFIFIVGSKQAWLDGESHLGFVYKTLTNMSNVFVEFLECPPDLQTSIAQISRLFAADSDFFRTKSSEDVYLVTSDADLFPLQNIYDLPDPGYDVRVTDKLQVGRFLHQRDNIEYDMFALSSIGMRISTWLQVMKYHEYTATSQIEMIKLMVNDEFGHLAYNASRGSNKEWYFDQQLISIKLRRWMDRFSTSGLTIDNKYSLLYTLYRYLAQLSVYGKWKIRWDRLQWPKVWEDRMLTYGTDAHCPMPGKFHTFMM